MKRKRHSEILKIIKENDISTQEELSNRLKMLGFKVTQATVSRDIKDLKLVKVPSDKDGSKYGFTGNSNQNNISRLSGIFLEAVVSYEYAQNIVVIKTLQGMAQGVAAVLDSISMDDILGSIAGDDTIMVVAKSEKHAAMITEKFKNMN